MSAYKSIPKFWVAPVPLVSYRGKEVRNYPRFCALVLFPEVKALWDTNPTITSTIIVDGEAALATVQDHSVLENLLYSGLATIRACQWTGNDPLESRKACYADGDLLTIYNIMAGQFNLKQNHFNGKHYMTNPVWEDPVMNEWYYNALERKEYTLKCIKIILGGLSKLIMHMQFTAHYNPYADQNYHRPKKESAAVRFWTVQGLAEAQATSRDILDTLNDDEYEQNKVTKRAKIIPVDNMPLTQDLVNAVDDAMLNTIVDNMLLGHYRLRTADQRRYNLESGLWTYPWDGHCYPLKIVELAEAQFRLLRADITNAHHADTAREQKQDYEDWCIENTKRIAIAKKFAGEQTRCENAALEGRLWAKYQELLPKITATAYGVDALPYMERCFFINYEQYRAYRERYPANVESHDWKLFNMYYRANILRLKHWRTSDKGHYYQNGLLRERMESKDGRIKYGFSLDNCIRPHMCNSQIDVYNFDWEKMTMHKPVAADRETGEIFEDNTPPDDLDL